MGPHLAVATAQYHNRAKLAQQNGVGRYFWLWPKIQSTAARLLQVSQTIQRCLQRDDELHRLRLGICIVYTGAKHLIHVMLSSSIPDPFLLH